MFTAPANDLVKQCMPDCKNLIKEATELVCDLHSPGTHYIPSQETSFNSLLRPRLPTEVSFNRLRSLNLSKYNRAWEACIEDQMN